MSESAWSHVNIFIYCCRKFQMLFALHVWSDCWFTHILDVKVCFAQNTACLSVIIWHSLQPCPRRMKNVVKPLITKFSPVFFLHSSNYPSSCWVFHFYITETHQFTVTYWLLVQYIKSTTNRTCNHWTTELMVFKSLFMNLCLSWHLLGRAANPWGPTDPVYPSNNHRHIGIQFFKNSRRLGDIPGDFQGFQGTLKFQEVSRVSRILRVSRHPAAGPTAARRSLNHNRLLRSWNFCTSVDVGCWSVFPKHLASQQLTN